MCFCVVVAIYDYMITDFGVHFICENQLNPCHQCSINDFVLDTGMAMKTYTIEEIEDKYIGKKGTE